MQRVLEAVNPAPVGVADLIAEINQLRPGMENPELICQTRFDMRLDNGELWRELDRETAVEAQ